MRQALKPLLRAIAALLLLALVIALVGPQRIATQLRAVSLPWFAAAVVCGSVANFISAWRWAGIARVLGLRAPLASMVSAYAQGITVNVLLPGATLGGDALRSVRLVRLGNAAAPSALSVVIDRASGLWVLCAMSLAAAAVFVLLRAGGWLLPTAALAGAMSAVGGKAWTLYFAGLLVAVLLPFAPWRAWPAGRQVHGTAPTAWAARVRVRLAQMHALVLDRRAALARSLVPSLAVQLLSAVTLWLCAHAAGAEVGLGAVIAIAAPIFIAAALPVSIGGFGTREMAAALAFPLAGASAQAGVSAAVLFGLTAVIQGVLAAPLLVGMRSKAAGD
jgi:hypothetical protein